MANLKISVLDVGHGDFIYAETPLRDNLVIDCGRNDIVPSSFLSNISSISELQISHPHTDHFDDIVAIAKKTIRSFRCPPLENFADNVIGWKKRDKVKIDKLRELKRTTSADNSAVRVGDGFGHTVWFSGEVNYDDPNTSSAVTTLSYQGFKMLFGGDLPESGWESLLEKDGFVRAIRNTKVFKVPHHGRREGCCESLFEAISPLLCIISDKPIEKDSENTAATDWYTLKSTGCNVVGSEKQRKVLTTRADGSIFISVNEKGTWSVYRNTRWED